MTSMLGAGCLWQPAPKLFVRSVRVMWVVQVPASSATFRLSNCPMAAQLVYSQRGNIE